MRFNAFDNSVIFHSSRIQWFNQCSVVYVERKTGVKLIYHQKLDSDKLSNIFQHQNTVLGVHSLATGRFVWNFRQVICKLMLVIDGWGISREMALKWMLLDRTQDRSTLVQVMAWCRQATSHYLCQCWPRPISPCGATGLQWAKSPVLISLGVPDIARPSVPKYLR